VRIKGRMARRRKVTYGVVGTIVVLVLIVYVLLQSEWLVLRIVAAAIERLEQAGAQMEVGDVSGSLLSGITLSEVEVKVARGEEPILSADMLSLRYSPILLATRRQLGTFSLYGPRLLLEKKNGTWNYSSLFTKEDSTGPREDTQKEGKIGVVLPFSLRHVSIQNGVIEIKTDQEVLISEINVFASVSSDSTETQITLHNGRLLVNDELRVERIRGDAVLNQSGLLLRDIRLKTNRSTIAMNGALDTLGIHVSLSDCDIDLEEFAQVLKPELALKGRVNVTGVYDQSGESREARGTMVVSGAEFMGREFGWLDFSLGVKDSRFDVMLNSWRLGEGSAKGLVNINMAGRKPTFALDCILDTFDLGRLIGREAVLSGKVKLNGTGSSLDEAGARGQVELTQSTIEGIRLEEMTSRFSYTSGVVNLESFDAIFGGGHIVSSGRISKDQVELDTEIHDIDLSELAVLIGISELKGSLNSYMWVSGPLDNPFLSGTAWVSKAQYKEMRFEHLGANVNIQDAIREPKGSVSVDLAGVEVGGPPLKRGSIELTALGDNVEYEIWASASEGSLDVKGKALYDEGRFEGELDRLFLTYRGQVVESVSKVAATYSRSSINLSPARVKILGTEMRLTGFVLSQDEARLGLAADSLSLKNLAQAIGTDLDVDGFLTFDLSVSGTPNDPEVDLSLELRGVVAGQASLDSAIARISYDDGLIRLDEFFVHRNGNISTLTGHFPFNLALDAEGMRIPERPISLDADFNDVGAWIFLPLKDIVGVDEGRIDADLSLRGTPRNPLVTGTMDISSPKVVFRPTVTIARDVTARLRLEGERLELVSITGRAGEGKVDVKGYVTFDGLTPDDYRVKIEARQASMEGFYRDIRDAVVNADVWVTRGSEMVEVSGNVEVLRCLLTTEFRQSAVPMAATKHEVSYDITVQAERNVRLKNRDADIEMAADVRVAWKPGKMVLSGAMDVLGGTFSYSDFTQKFTVKRGEFVFSNAPELNPSLDIEAETHVRVEEVNLTTGELEHPDITLLLTVGGTMLEPEFHLSSPSRTGYTETQILSLIGIGFDPTGEIQTDTNPLTRAGDIGLGILQNRIISQLQKTTGLDELRVQTELFGTEKTAQLKVGKYIRSDLYLSYSHDLFATVKDEYKAEYYLWRHSSIEGGRNNEGFYFLGMGFRIRY